MCLSQPAITVVHVQYMWYNSEERFICLDVFRLYADTKCICDNHTPTATSEDMLPALPYTHVSFTHKAKDNTGEVCRVLLSTCGSVLSLQKNRKKKILKSSRGGVEIRKIDREQSVFSLSIFQSMLLGNKGRQGKSGENISAVCCLLVHFDHTVDLGNKPETGKETNGTSKQKEDESHDHGVSKVEDCAG